MARYDPEWIAKLLDPERKLGSLTAREFLFEAGLGPEMTLVDYGSGPGYFTLAAAEIVGKQGTVYALDIEPRMVRLARDRASEAGLQNVEALLIDGAEAPLPGAVADLAVCSLVFHYREDREARLALAQDIGRLLKPGGRTVVVQWEDRFTYEETAELLASGGLECQGPYATAENQYKVLATKPR